MRGKCSVRCLEILTTYQLNNEYTPFTILPYSVCLSVCQNGTGSGIGVEGVSCRISYSIVSYLYVSFSGLITSIWEERASFSAIVYL